ncbi:hypothetical protein CRUP_016694 [Coryphaenoides rupestris]|nr:hypothetical protein CRUP_016694 [Coryphaenoides rupestris]
MGGNNSTRRVSFESDDNENITVVKGIRLSENVINRMRDGGTSPPPQTKPHTVTTPPPPPSPKTSPAPPPPPRPVLRPIPPPFDPVTSMPAAPRVEAMVPLPAPAPESVAKPSPPPPTPPPPPPPPVKQVQSLALPPAPAPVPALAQETAQAPPTTTTAAAAGLAEKVEVAALAQADAQARVQQEVSQILAVERALSQDTLHQAVLRERATAEDEKLRARRYAKKLEAREAELKNQDAFYREQVARLEERSAQLYKVTTENYHKAADQLSARFK